LQLVPTPLVVVGIEFVPLFLAVLVRARAAAPVTRTACPV
jgi:hypothetical protein